jgi:beta-phosphoglucomutase-like phosphatase (HAD superfamily)
MACAAVEDSANGIRSALAAGLRVVAIPNPDYRPPDSVLARAQVVIGSLADLTVELVDQLDAGDAGDPRD